MKLAILFLIARVAFAWSELGHNIVGEIASKHLTGRANSEIKSILQEGETLVSVGNWADEARDLKEWTGSNPWHYVNIADNKAYLDQSADKKGDVIQAIVRFEDVLRNKAATQSEKQAAVKFLVHFVADIHQPLHVGRAKDAGGNKIYVKWFGVERTPTGPKYNLHRVWDHDIIQKIIADQKVEGGYKAYATSLDKGENKEVVQWQSSYILDWAKESQNYRDAVYAIKNGNIDDDYFQKAAAITHTRLLQAGYRLARLLNDAFSGEDLLPAAKELRAKLSRNSKL